jgi:hypothetical protein
MPLVFDPLPDWSDPAVSRGFTSKPTRRPDTFNRIPTQVAGMPVLAAVPDGDSNRVYVIATDTRRERRPYVVFTTWWDGERWQASNGHYDLPLSKALGVLTERLRWEVRPTVDTTAGGDR